MKEQLVSICAEECTDCKACMAICPVQCITEKRNDDGRIELCIDIDKCIGCNKCRKICPQIVLPRMNYPIQAYAAWSGDKTEKEISASGGIASALYRYAISQKWYFVGAYYDVNDYRVKLDIGCNVSDIDRFRNSKYVHSDAGHIYQQCQMLIDSGNNVIFVGLPCQVAAMRKYERRKDYSGRIIYVDLVCHGTPPEEYLQNHIQSIEENSGIKAEKCFFRDPRFGTNNFVFSLTSKSGDIFYSKKVVSEDCYQIGFHRAIIYRENCYACKFARPERCGDITLGDYKGLGFLEKYEGNRMDVSCVLANTEDGVRLIQDLVSKEYIVAHKRPVCEPIQADHQLNSPSVPHSARKKFILRYRQKGCFAETSQETIGIVTRQELLMEKFHIKKVKGFFCRLSPRRVYFAIKRRLK